MRTPVPPSFTRPKFDVAFWREIQRAGAFFDSAGCLAISLRSYLAAPLPPRDHCDPAATGRMGSPTPPRHGSAG